MTEEISFEKIGDKLIDAAGNIYEMADGAIEAALDAAKAIGGFVGELIKAAINNPWLFIVIPIVALVAGIAIGAIFMGKAAPVMAAGRIAERILLPPAK